jgi:hypothetical protein
MKLRIVIVLGWIGLALTGQGFRGVQLLHYSMSSMGLWDFV